MIRVSVTPLRCWIFGRRTHHALTGFAIVGVGIRHRSLPVVLAGAALVASDWQDCNAWLADFLRHPAMAR